ncbi:Trihelix transcription factor ENAP1 [Linum grandiflorum]
MGDLTTTDSGTQNPTSATATRPVPIREDCWSEEATATLVDAWGNRYLELNRGNLRQKDWKDVADAVNAVHGLTKKTHRTDVQCKNRVDTVKKKYKAEKARLTASNGAIPSSWPFFDRLDHLIGPNFTAAAASGKNPPQPKREPHQSPSSPPVALPLTTYRKPAALPQKRAAADEGYFRRNYSAMAAAAAAAAAPESESEEEEEEEMEVEKEKDEEGEGVRRLARAIERFGDVYERVESEKLRQMIDLEKQRMKFAKDLEMERMRIFTETQIQLERIKKGKRSNGERDY